MVGSTLDRNPLVDRQSIPLLPLNLAILSILAIYRLLLVSPRRSLLAAAPLTKLLLGITMLSMQAMKFQIRMSLPFTRNIPEEASTFPLPLPTQENLLIRM